VTILKQSTNYLVISKPPSVVVHHSEETGSRSREEVPMLQRTRDFINRRVNLIHRLDRGCSGCLLLTYADTEQSSDMTSHLIDAMANSTAQKTYIALVRGEGILHGQDLKQQGWFRIDRPIANEAKKLNEAATWFRFVAGQGNQNGELDRPRASLVLARPETGRWHQVRRHLNGLSHPILGDSTHGISRINREWKKLGMPPERTCLHLARMQLGPTNLIPSGIDVSCPLAPDMLKMLQEHLPNVLKEAEPILREEGISLY
jgi:tRNA pseudouridine65 synthase